MKHLLVADVTKRYGCLKNGANDIKNHRWFKTLDWYKLSQKKIPAPYIPQIAKAGDTSNFSEYPDSEEKSPEVRPKDDPFLEWWRLLYNTHSLTLLIIPLVTSDNFITFRALR